MILRLLMRILQALGNGGDCPVAAHLRPCCTSSSNLLRSFFHESLGALNDQQDTSGRCLLEPDVAVGASQMTATSPSLFRFNHSFGPSGALASPKHAIRSSRVEVCSSKSNAGHPRAIQSQAWQRADTSYEASTDHKNAESCGAGLKGYARPVSLRELKRQKEAYRTASDGAEQARRQSFVQDPNASQPFGVEPGSDDYGADEVKRPQGHRKQTQDDQDRSVKREKARDVLPTSYRRNGSFLSNKVLGGNKVSSNVDDDFPVLDIKNLHITDKVDTTNATQHARPSLLTAEEFLKREAATKRDQGIRDEDNTALSALESLGRDQDFQVQDRQKTRRRAQQRSSLAPWKVKYDEAAAAEGKEPDPTEVEEAKEKAITLLNRRHKSASELRDKLSQYGFPANAVKAAVDRMQEVGLQNDLDYAEAFARVRWQGFRWGPDRVRRELKMKGVGAADVERAITAVYGKRAGSLRVSADREDSWAEAGYDLDEDVSGSIERELYIAAKRQFLSGGGQDVNRRWKKTADWLARRGFNWGTVSSIMTALKSEPGLWV